MFNSKWESISLSSARLRDHQGKGDREVERIRSSSNCNKIKQLDMTEPFTHMNSQGLWLQSPRSSQPKSHLDEKLLVIYGSKRRESKFSSGVQLQKKYSLFSMLSRFMLPQSILCLLYVYVWVPRLSGSLRGSLYDNGGMKSETGRDNRGGTEVGAMGEGFDQIIRYIIRGLWSHIFWI